MNFQDYVAFESLSLADIAVRIIAAALLGGALGIERQVSEKPLGVRPFVLIAMGSCLAVLASLELGLSPLAGDTLHLDPGKVIGGIVGGIGFLGAGAMFRNDGHVRGAATAASVWLSGVIGIACAVGFILPAALAVVLGLALLILAPTSREQATKNDEGGQRPPPDAGK